MTFDPCDHVTWHSMGIPQCVIRESLVTLVPCVQLWRYDDLCNILLPMLLAIVEGLKRWFGHFSNLGSIDCTDRRCSNLLVSLLLPTIAPLPFTHQSVRFTANRVKLLVVDVRSFTDLYLVFNLGCVVWKWSEVAAVA